MPAAERSLCNDPLGVAGVQCERSWPSSGELGAIVRANVAG